MDEHTLEHPYCGNLSCWCHSNSCYHSTVLTLIERDETNVREALAFFEVRGETQHVELAYIAVD
jgi:hypothetical protein